MGHPILWGILAGALAARVAFRFWRFRRYGYGGCGRRGWRARRFGGPATWHRIIAALRGLDLNQRQKEDARDVLGKIRESIAAERARTLDDLLGAVGGDGFDRAKAEAALAREPHLPEGARKEILDGLEHLHNILTPEQRAHLRATLAGEPPASPPQTEL
jgi:Spy/CpxP family protein refolding chaperone